MSRGLAEPEARVPAPAPTETECRVLAAGSLTGRAALVSGAGTGIGRAIALRLAELGANVVGVARRAEPLAETARAAAAASLPGTFRWRTLNVRDRNAVAACVADIGSSSGLDIVVNNAGGQFVAPAQKISNGGIDAVLDLNLTAVAHLIAAARRWLAARGGTVITISLSGAERGIPGLSHSAAARAGIAELTARLADEWRSDGIKLYCLAPGTVLTDGVRGELTPESLAAALAATPLGRDTTLGEVAEWVAALACSGVGVPSGSLVELDGGAALLGSLQLIPR